MSSSIKKWTAALALPLLAFAAPAVAAPSEPAEPIRVELNTAAPVKDQCRLSFVVENKAGHAIDSLKLDLVMFGRDGIIDRRLVVELGPLRAAKTMVKTFAADGACDALGSVLVNDVTACAPDDVNACLTRLELKSRIPQVRLFK